MEDFLTCRISLGKRSYIGMWRQLGDKTFVYCGEEWDCAPTLRQPPRRVAEMLLKRMVERGRSAVRASALGAIAPPPPTAQVAVTAFV